MTGSFPYKMSCWFGRKMVLKWKIMVMSIHFANHPSHKWIKQMIISMLLISQLCIIWLYSNPIQDPVCFVFVMWFFLIHRCLSNLMRITEELRAGCLNFSQHTFKLDSSLFLQNPGFSPMIYFMNASWIFNSSYTSDLGFWRSAHEKMKWVHLNSQKPIISWEFSQPVILLCSVGYQNLENKMIIRHFLFQWEM